MGLHIQPETNLELVPTDAKPYLPVSIRHFPPAIPSQVGVSDRSSSMRDDFMTIRSGFPTGSHALLPDWTREQSLISLLLLVSAAHIIYYFTKSYLQYRVCHVLWT
jgi:hypothetical protein